MAAPSSGGAGVLDLDRRCTAQTCEGHCTCGRQDYPCTPTSSSSTCQDVKGNSAYQGIIVSDVTNIQSTQTTHSDTEYTRSQCVLSAKWSVVAGPGQPPIGYEWSVGLKGQQPGSGLLDFGDDPIWRDAVKSERIGIFTLNRNRGEVKRMLQSNAEYIVHVKAWYSPTKYAVYQSDGISTDFSAPEISRSIKVKETRNQTVTEDVDFITSKSTVTISWKNVFRDDHAGLSKFVVSVGRCPGCTDVGVRQTTGTVLYHTFTGLSLMEGRKYYSSVTAYNEANLATMAHSDDFQVDTTKPIAGTVWDGRDIHDLDYQSSSDIVSASWHGFSDPQSSILYYMWGVGTTPGASDILSFTNVGVRVNKQRQLTRKLTTGQKYYSTVYAVDAAGLESDKISTDGLTIDTTPPRPIYKFRFGNNLLGDPSFEIIPVTSEYISSSWDITGIVKRETKGIASDGSYYIDIHGSIKQYFQTTALEKYKVTFYIAHSDVTTSSTTPRPDGLITLPGLQKVFVLSNRPQSGKYSESKPTGEWQKLTYYFTASETRSSITISTIGRFSQFRLDNVMVQHMDEGQRPSSSDDRDPTSLHKEPIHVDVVSSTYRSSVTAQWDIVDPESPIRRYYWAIGTVKGGTQIQGFRSLGRRSQGHADSLLLDHGSHVHVTVVAENAAGLSAAIYSDPVTVDLTPPDLCCVKDSQSDALYQTTTVIQSSWSAVDKESNVTSCEWALGKAPGSTMLQNFTSATLAGASTDLKGRIQHGETVYVTVRCVNYVGLQSVSTSKGVTIVTKAPDTTSASLTVIPSSPSHYPPRDSHLVSTNDIIISWKNFEDPAGIKQYEFKLTDLDTGADHISWTPIGSSCKEFARVNGLNLRSYKTYVGRVRAKNNADRWSNIVSTSFTVETAPPNIIGNKLKMAWANAWTLDVDWTSVFSSNSTMIFEISMGTQRGSSDVLAWVPSTKSSMRITGVDNRKIYYISVTSINKAGLFSTQTFEIA